MGYFLSTKGLMGYTAKLTVNYVKPLPQNTKCVMRINHVKTERRKVFLEGVLENEDTGEVYSKGEALYIVDKRMVKMEIGKEIEEFL